MNQHCNPEISVSGLSKRCQLFFLMAAVVCGCTSNDPEGSLKTASSWVKSPFAGTWISADSDMETAFKLFIVQEEDSLRGYYCLIKQDSGKSECQTPNSEHRGLAFTIETPQTTAFSTELYDLRRQKLGHVLLTLTDSVLFWQLLRGPDDPEFMIRQTTFRMGTPLE